MNAHVKRFFSQFADDDLPVRIYHEVIPLHESPLFSWEEISLKVPSLPKGWYELARLDVRDRIEFIRSFWLTTIPYVPHVYDGIQNFFSKLDDVGIYVTQVKYDSPYQCEMVYSLRDEACFFHGFPPCSKHSIEKLSLDFNDCLPEDYLIFLKIHDGFSKHADTGILRAERIQMTYERLQIEALQEITSAGKRIDSKELIPFYESFGQNNYQCFFLNWAPGKQMGNVYYAASEKTISDYRNRENWAKNLAFPTFSDWFIFYLEVIDF